MVGSPNLPGDDGGMVVEYSPLVESAHRLGRVLRMLGSEGFSAAVRGEVAAEMTAVEQAELGDLSGRAVQAVVLSRTATSPVQVAAADALLRQDPLAGIGLFTTMDPTSAAVAAAHWLHAAATVAAEASGFDVAQIIEVIDEELEAVPAVAPTAVLRMIETGISPDDAVTALVGEALDVAAGKLPDPAGLLDALTEAAEAAEDLDPGNDALAEVAVAQIRTTPLDTSRPALALLEDLLIGIRACALLYQDYEGEIADEETVKAFDAGLEDVDDRRGVRRLPGRRHRLPELFARSASTPPVPPASQRSSLPG